MKRGATDNPKMDQLAELMGVPERYALAWANGAMERIWHYTSKYAPQGDLGAKAKDKKIAEIVGWPVKEAAQLVTALVSAKWLDRHPIHRLLVHDWHEHCDETTRKTLQRKGLPFFCPDIVGNLSEHLPDQNGVLPSQAFPSQLEGRKEGAAAPPPTPDCEFPQTHAEISKCFPGTALLVTNIIATIAQQIEPDIADSSLALAIRATHWPGQKTPWAWRKKVPEYLRSVPPDERSRSPGLQLVRKAVARSHARDPARERSAGLQRGIDLIREEILAAEAASGE